MKHPAAQDALRYINTHSYDIFQLWLETFEEEDSELSIRCRKALKNLTIGREVEDIDILGLAYVMKQGECG